MWDVLLSASGRHTGNKVEFVSPSSVTLLPCSLESEHASTHSSASRYRPELAEFSFVPVVARHLPGVVYTIADALLHMSQPSPVSLSLPC